MQEYHHAFYEQRKGYLDALLDAYRSFDKTMITLSAGALGLSVVFVKEVAPAPAPETIWGLHIAWGLFGLALVLILSSFLTSQYSWQRAMDREDEAFTNGGVPPESGNAWAGATKILNISCLVAFATGVLAFVWFSTVNFTGVG
ncbi:hypothetical protein ElP_65120 [Tautonia plasticadhaerens]|uniref:DUF202 domain-containing protein n=1 Tax=Tautonia plasticadhaerens TaxID=2527974 RepID=A0A518HCJ0_9BACT|nr:hypothetical protein ElP_65120 [Tautonia plasticadhaerens]